MTLPKNWKTTLLGVLALVMAVAPIWVPAKYAAKLQQTATALSGIGLLAAKDHDQQ